MRPILHLSVMLITAAATPMTFSPAAAAAKGGNKLVCKSDSGTGSRVPARTCHTRAEWDKISEENRRAASEMVNRYNPGRAAGAESVDQSRYCPNGGDPSRLC